MTEHRVTLDPADFYRVVAKMRHVEVLRLEAKEQARAIAMQIATVSAEGQQLLEQLAAKYGFDPSVDQRFEEATCEFVAVHKEAAP